MSYFTQFNSIVYPDFSRPEDASLVLRNITSRVVRRENLIDDKNIFYTYTMKEEEGIEDVSNKLYGTPEYYWVIMLVNNRFDRFYDFPIRADILANHIIEKYGSILTAVNQKKYYIRPDKLLYSSNPAKDEQFWFEVPFGTYITYPVTDSNIPMRREISMYDYEITANEAKRNILVLQTNHLSAFVRNFETLIR